MVRNNEIRIALGQGIAGLVALTGKTLNIPEAYQVYIYCIVIQIQQLVPLQNFNQLFLSELYVVFEGYKIQPRYRQKDWLSDEKYSLHAYKG